MKFRLIFRARANAGDVPFIAVFKDYDNPVDLARGAGGFFRQHIPSADYYNRFLYHCRDRDWQCGADCIFGGDCTVIIDLDCSDDREIKITWSDLDGKKFLWGGDGTRFMNYDGPTQFDKDAVYIESQIVELCGAECV